MSKYNNVLGAVVNAVRRPVREAVWDAVGWEVWRAVRWAVWDAVGDDVGDSDTTWYPEEFNNPKL